MRFHENVAVTAACRPAGWRLTTAHLRRAGQFGSGETAHRTHLDLPAQASFFGLIACTLRPSHALVSRNAEPVKWCSICDSAQASLAACPSLRQRATSSQLPFASTNGVNAFPHPQSTSGRPASAAARMRHSYSAGLPRPWTPAASGVRPVSAMGSRPSTTSGARPATAAGPRPGTALNRPGSFQR